MALQDYNISLDRCNYRDIIHYIETNVLPLIARIFLAAFYGGNIAMLTGISSLITPEIYEAIFRMGHLDELVIADANYKASAMSKNVVYSYSKENHLLLAEILKYFPLDEDVEFPITVMSLDYGIYEEPAVWDDFQNVLKEVPSANPLILNKISRKEFYQRTRDAYATIQTADSRPMADIIIRKGFVFSEP